MKKQEVKAIIRFVLAVWLLLVFGIVTAIYISRMVFAVTRY